MRLPVLLMRFIGKDQMFWVTDRFLFPILLVQLCRKKTLKNIATVGWNFPSITLKILAHSTLNLGGNISYSREKIEYVDQPVYASEEERRRQNRVGQWADTQWGYQADGVFTSQEEIDNWAIIDGRNNATVNVGDIKLIDYNGDGVINSSDNVIIGSGTFPDIIYGYPWFRYRQTC